MKKLLLKTVKKQQNSSHRKSAGVTLIFAGGTFSFHGNEYHCNSEYQEECWEHWRGGEPGAEDWELTVLEKVGAFESLHVNGKKNSRKNKKTYEN